MKRYSFSIRDIVSNTNLVIGNCSLDMILKVITKEKAVQDKKITERKRKEGVEAKYIEKKTKAKISRAKQEKLRLKNNK